MYNMCLGLIKVQNRTKIYVLMALDLSKIDHITWTSSYPQAITSPCKSTTCLSCSAN